MFVYVGIDLDPQVRQIHLNSPLYLEQTFVSLQQ
jgi:hypothetical protein